MAVIVEVFIRCFLDRAVHPFDLPIGPRVPWLCRPVLNDMSLVGAIERMPSHMAVGPERFFRTPLSVSTISIL